MNILSQDIMYLPGVGPNKKDVLNKELGVRTWGDLLEYYPYKYVDRSRIYAIHELTSDMPFVQIRGKILSFEEFEMSARKKRVVAHFTDGRGVVDLVWFSGAQYVYKTYKVQRLCSPRSPYTFCTHTAPRRTTQGLPHRVRR